MPLKYGVPKYIDGVRNPEWDKRERIAHRSKRNAYQLLWRAAHREKCNAYTRKWFASLTRKEKLAYWREHRRAYKARHPERYYALQRSQRLKAYGLTLEAYEVLLKAQHKRCAICGAKHQEQPRKRLSVDHNHHSGKVRALLCTHCNSVLGNTKDDIRILEKAIAYLRSFQ